MTDIEENGKGKVLIVKDSDDGIRLDRYIADSLPEDVSRNRVKDVIKSAIVYVNDSICDSPNYRVKPGDELRFELPPPTDATPEPFNMPLDVLYEDKELIVVNKPAGLVVHPAAGNWSKTLVNALLHHCGDSLSGIGGVRRPGIVHRLDKNTSGVMVVAKTDRAHRDLSEQFSSHGRTRNLDRRYTALIWGRIAKKNGTIDTFLGRSPKARTKRAVVSESAPDARRAITHYKVISEHGISTGGEPLVSLVECKLETGRTHQIRVHMAHLGHPVVGDPEYSRHFMTKVAKLPQKAMDLLLKMNRQALHAATLGFEHPVSGDFMQFKSDLPEDMGKLLKYLD